jgi:diguanylate cyclase (GGDEF)-like protein/PAS domain S-box-containing protein
VAFAHLPSDVLVVIDEAGAITSVSSSIQEVLGYSPEEFREVVPTNLIHADDRDEAAVEYERLRRREVGELSAELRMRHGAGHWTWIELMATNAVPPEMGAAVINFRDISDRKGAEEALRASEERFKALAQHSFDVMMIIGEDRSIRWASPSTSRVFGYEDGRLVGTAGTDLIHPDDLGIVAESLATLSEDPSTVTTTEVRARHADGSWRWVESINVNLLDNPEINGIVANVRDITDRKNTADALRASEERFRAVVLNSLDVTGLLDTEGHIVWISPRVQNVLGYEPNRVAGQSVFDFIHPDDADLAAQRLAETAGGSTTSPPITIRARKSDGSLQAIEAAGAPLLDDEGNIDGVIINLRDVGWRVDAQRALEQSEERFKALVRHAPGVVEILDAAGEITWVSPAVEATLGYASGDMVGSPGLDYVHPDDRQRAQEIFADVLRDPGGTARIELRLIHADGSTPWVDFAFTNQLEEPAIEGLVGNFRDITARKQTELAMHDSEVLFRTLAESSPVGIFTIDTDGRTLWANERWLEITGLNRNASLGRDWRTLVQADDSRPADGSGTDTSSDESPTPGEPNTETYRIVRPDEAIRWVTVKLAPMNDPADQGAAAVGTLDDITDRVATERDMTRLTNIFDATPDIVGIADREGKLLYMNDAAREFYRLGDEDQAQDFNLVDPFPPWIVERLYNEIQPALERDGMWGGEIALQRGDGTLVPVSAQLLAHHDDTGEFAYFSGILRDISDRKEFEEQLAHQATHDPLTGLPNRVLLLDQLQFALSRARRHHRAVAVLFLDLDHFKVVNDSLGHGLGDQLLVAIANRLKAAVRPGDTVARFGGDEFVLMCEQLEAEDDVVAIAKRVEEAISGSFTINDSELFVGVSIGIAISTDATIDPETLIRDADAAMYRAKDRGRARYEIFDSAMRDSAVDRLDIENALRRSLDRHELRVYYQPIIQLDTGAIAGVEALLRWEHAERGLLLPGEFITIAEETGLIVPIGRWVLNQACRQVQRWMASNTDGAALIVNVNLSGRQLGHPDLVADVRAILDETGIDSARVELEITESVLMDDVEMSDVTLSALRSLGVKLVVDDFGTGYSSLSYLRQVPVDVLKVDRSFVAGLGKDQGDTAIVAAIVNLAHTLGLRAVAEGVETEDQLIELREMGCDLAQGYHLARPMDSDALAHLLSRNPRF